MIGSLRGVLVEIHPPYALLDVQGVGYEVFCSQRTLQALRVPKPEVSLVIETHVRPEALCLYGFEHQDERQWFRLLQTVPGVGAKVAMALLSLYSPHDLTAHIQHAQSKALTQAEGVGAKLAARITSELKDKVMTVFSADVSTHSPLAASTSGVVYDVTSALIHLGYRPAEAQTSVQRAMAALDPAVHTFEPIFRHAVNLLNAPSS